MTIEWKGSYKIGNASIDAQHQVWFVRIDSVLEATGRKSMAYREGFFGLTFW
jgi:hemerythrin